MIAFRGREVVPGWPARLREAQRETTVEIDGTEYRRVPYGREHRVEHPNGGTPHEPAAACRDCVALMGELHVPDCQAERCPRCGGQFISCGCLEES